MHTTAAAACAVMLAMSDLTLQQQKLADEIRRLCLKTHGKEHVIGWELVLFRACLGQATLTTVDYNDMANLLYMFRECNGWIVRFADGEKFVPRDEWARIMKTMESK